MQLLVLALLLLTAGKNANMKELRPIIESIGGDGAASAFKQAEELSGVLSAMQSLTSAGGRKKSHDCAANPTATGADCGYPLEPIANIADERITYSLSRYVALGE